MAALGGIKVTKSNAKVLLTLVNSTDDLSTAQLYLQRVGANIDFAVYGPVKTTINTITFAFDSVLLDQPFGRYSARLTLDGVDKLTFYLQYTDIEDIEATNTS